MKKKVPISEVRTKKRQQLIERTQAALQLESPEEAEALLSIGRKQAVRINPLKGDPAATQESFLELAPQAVVSPLYNLGYSVLGDTAAVRDSSLQQEGYVYIQNAASWLPVLQLNPQAGERVLDMCAAPGGKTSLIAALTVNQAHLTANDNSRPRLMRLKANMERLGAQVERYTLYDASRLASALSNEQFDKILLDAPCSGEGMLRISEPSELDTWSVAHIKRLGKLQRRLIIQAWQLLRPGGELVYSTCTMAPEENEAVVDYLLRHVDNAEIVQHDYPKDTGLYRVEPVLSWGERSYDARIRQSLRLAPSEAAEAFYVCHLKKTAE